MVDFELQDVAPERFPRKRRSQSPKATWKKISILKYLSQWFFRFTIALSSPACRASSSITVWKVLVTSFFEDFGSTVQEPVSVWIGKLAAADQDAAGKLWEHFCQRLMIFARSRMSPTMRRIYDEEDAAASAFRSLCRGIEAQRFPDVGDRGNLWALLVVITSRKILNQYRFEHQQKRNATNYFRYLRGYKRRNKKNTKY